MNPYTGQLHGRGDVVAAFTDEGAQPSGETAQQGCMQSKIAEQDYGAADGWSEGGPHACADTSREVEQERAAQRARNNGRKPKQHLPRRFRESLGRTTDAGKGFDVYSMRSSVAASAPPGGAGERECGRNLLLHAQPLGFSTNRMRRGNNGHVEQKKSNPHSPEL